jgi:hypothetical protein
MNADNVVVSYLSDSSCFNISISSLRGVIRAGEMISLTCSSVVSSNSFFCLDRGGESCVIMVEASSQPAADCVDECLLSEAEAETELSSVESGTLESAQECSRLLGMADALIADFLFCGVDGLLEVGEVRLVSVEVVCVRCDEVEDDEEDDDSVASVAVEDSKTAGTDSDELICC